MLSKATFAYLDEIAERQGRLLIRHEPDDGPPEYVSVRPEAITAVRVRPDTEDADESEDEPPAGGASSAFDLDTNPWRNDLVH